VCRLQAICGTVDAPVLTRSPAACDPLELDLKSDVEHPAAQVNFIVEKALIETAGVADGALVATFQREREHVAADWEFQAAEKDAGRCRARRGESVTEDVQRVAVHEATELGIPIADGTHSDADVGLDVPGAAKRQEADDCGHRHHLQLQGLIDVTVALVDDVEVHGRHSALGEADARPELEVFAKTYTPLSEHVTRTEVGDIEHQRVREIRRAAKGQAIKVSA